MILPGPDYGGKMIKMIQTVKVLWPDNVYPSSAALAKLKKLIPAGQKPKIFKSGGTTFYQYRKNGGYGTATKDFNSVNPTNVKTYTKVSRFHRLIFLLQSACTSEISLHVT